MKLKSLQSILGTAATLFVLSLTGQQAQAFTSSSWSYSIDSFNDGTDYTGVGENSLFEFYGMAYTETEDSITFAFNSNLSLDGAADAGALNGSISYGDLMLNFANPGSFESANGSLFGIRFTQSNDTGVGIGLYSKVSATSVTTQNVGYSSMNDHTGAVAWLGEQASYGDMAADTTYFDGTKAAYTTIGSGTFLGGITMLDSFDGLDFGQFGTKGTHTFGFSISKTLLPHGKFVASLFAECGNDGIVLMGDVAQAPQPEPEPIEPVEPIEPTPEPEPEEPTPEPEPEEPTPEPAPEEPTPEPQPEEPEEIHPEETVGGSIESTPEPSAMIGLAAVGLMAGATKLRRRA